MTDPLHPANRLEWLQTVEGGQAVCEHCGLPFPCVDAVLVHMATDWHHDYCQAARFCYVARVPIDELPKL